MKHCDVFLIFAQNIDCGYTLEGRYPDENAFLKARMLVYVVLRDGGKRGKPPTLVRRPLPWHMSISWFESGGPQRWQTNVIPLRNPGLYDLGTNMKIITI